MSAVHIRDLFEADPERSSKFSLYFEDLLFDFSKNRITEETLTELYSLASQS